MRLAQEVMAARRRLVKLPTSRAGEEALVVTLARPASGTMTRNGSLSEDQGRTPLMIDGRQETIGLVVCTVNRGPS
jgi:hypothetical protein